MSRGECFFHLAAAGLRGPLFDRAQFCILGELEEEGDAEIIREVAGQFLEDADETMDALHTGIEAENFVAVTMAAHTLKGSFATFGLMRAHALAREIEQLAEVEEGDQLAWLYRSMVGCFAAGRRSLEAHLGQG